MTYRRDGSTPGPIASGFGTAIVLAAVGISSLVVLTVAENALPQPLSRHMLQHALTMNVLAPGVAWALHARTGVDRFACSPAILVALTSAQLLVLWGGTSRQYLRPPTLISS